MDWLRGLVPSGTRLKYKKKSGTRLVVTNLLGLQEKVVLGGLWWHAARNVYRRRKIAVNLEHPLMQILSSNLNFYSNSSFQL